MFNVSKKHLSNIFTVNNIDTRMTAASIVNVNFEHISHFILLLLLLCYLFKQIYTGWAWEEICWETLICWYLREIYCPMGWENLLDTCFHPYSPNIRLCQGKFSWQHSKKISPTLEKTSSLIIKKQNQTQNTFVES